MQSSQRRVWHSLAITLSAVGVVSIVLSFATYAVILGRISNFLLALLFTC